MMFRVLGPLEVELDAERITLSGLRLRALLTALLMQPNTVVPAHRLAEAVWGDQPSDKSANALHVLVGRLRPRLGPLGGAILTRPPGYLLVAEKESVDSECFEAGYRSARSLWSEDPGGAAMLLDEALALWRGPAYGEFADGFAQAAATRLEELRVSALAEQPCCSSAAPRARRSRAPVISWHSSRCASGRSSCSCGPCTRTGARARRWRPTGGTGRSSRTSSV